MMFIVVKIVNCIHYSDILVVNCKLMAILFLILLFIICVGGCYWLSVNVFDAIFKTSNKTIIHNHYYTTENHLHVSKDDLQDIIDTSHIQSP